MASKRKLAQGEDKEVISKSQIVKQLRVGFSSDAASSALLEQISSITQIKALKFHRTTLGKVALPTYT